MSKCFSSDLSQALPLTEIPSRCNKYLGIHYLPEAKINFWGSPTVFQKSWKNMSCFRSNRTQKKSVMHHHVTKKTFSFFTILTFITRGVKPGNIF
jgi:hypothetical protein